MKPTLLYFLISVLIISCAPHQYFALSGENITKEKNRNFIYENDTLKVEYSFSGEGCPARVTILNKLNEPLKIDWQRSAIIYNSQSTSFYRNSYDLNANFESSASRTTSSERPVAAHTNGYMKGDIEGKEKEDFIPPGAFISSSALQVPVKALQSVYFDSVKRRKLNINNEVIVNYRVLEFSKIASPLLLRSYLSFSVGRENREFVLEHRFFVSKAWQTDPEPAANSSFNNEIKADFYL